MRYLIAFFTALLFVGAAYADAELECVVPTAGVPRAVELCEILRVKMRMPAARWDNDICATEFLRRGLRDGDAAVTQNTARQAVREAVSDALTDFDADHPSGLVPAACGDSTVDTEFGEECDDGNLEDGDGCDVFCQTE